MSKIIKNITQSDIFIKSLGRRVDANSQIEVDPRDFMLLATDENLAEMATLIDAGSLVINTGSQDLSPATAVSFLAYPDNASSQAFANDQLRSNGLVSENTQEAVEEAFLQACAAIYSIHLIHNGTRGRDTFLSYSNLTPGTPIVVPVDSQLLGLAFSNSRDGADCIIEIRRNTDLGAPLESATVADSRTFFDNFDVPIPFEAGDTMSVKYIDNGGNASDLVVSLYFRGVPK